MRAKIAGALIKIIRSKHSNLDNRYEVDTQSNKVNLLAARKNKNLCKSTVRKRELELKDELEMKNKNKKNDSTSGKKKGMMEDATITSRRSKKEASRCVFSNSIYESNGKIIYRWKNHRDLGSSWKTEPQF